MKRVALLAIFCVYPLFAEGQNSEKPVVHDYLELFREQKLDESISAFLQVLEKKKSAGDPAPASEKFKQAYAIYLNLHGKASPVIAQELICDYGPTTDDPYLAYLLAASYANIGRFDLFYPLFLQAYGNDSQYYMADKTFAVLHIKLYERLLPGEQKEREREEIHRNLQNALLKNPSDHMLYKMMIAFAPETSRREIVETALQAMIKEKVVYPRGDLMFYVRAAIAVNDRPLAQQFVDYSKGVFGYSRALEAAQRMLESKEL